MATLLHVNTSEVLATRFFDGAARPAWLPEDENTSGSITVRPWDDSHLMVFETFGLVREEFALRVTLAALYQLVDGDDLATPEKQRDFVAAESSTLFPFLRHAVYAASSQVWPVEPVMLDPRSFQLANAVRPG